MSGRGGHGGSQGGYGGSQGGGGTSVLRRGDIRLPHPLEDGDMRKRLLFVRRKISPDSILSSTQQVCDHTKSDYKLVWNDSTTLYYDQNTVNRLKTKVYNRTQDPKDPMFQIQTSNIFTTFQVIIPSLCFINIDQKIQKGLKFSPGKGTEKVQQYMREYHRKQIGSHVYCNEWGKIREVFANILDGDYTISNPSPISSIYPCFRYGYSERHPLQELVFGLHYTNYFLATDWNTGNRYNHRQNFDKIEAGGVWEITQSDLDQLEDQMEGRKYFGFYVCVGAKLVVVDNCAQTQTVNRTVLRNLPHNRSLVQNGGLVIVETEQMIFDKGLLSTKMKQSNFCDYIQFCNELKSVAKNPLIKEYPLIEGYPLIEEEYPLIEEYENPIIFLGAIDSSFNSIAWKLDVSLDIEMDQHPLLTPNLFTITHLKLPEGGRIVAIANGVNGIREMRQRVYYEMLHDSVLTKTEQYLTFRIFETTNFDDIQDILNVNDYRSFDINHGLMNNGSTEEVYSLPNRRPIPLFKEFNFQTLTYIYENAYIRRFRPPVPPMYPPLCPIGSQPTYMPNQMMATTVENCYSLVTADKQSIDPYDQTYKFGRNNETQVCKLVKNQVIEEYDWIRAENPNITEEMVDGVYTRIGVDGWVWEKCSTLPTIYKSNASVYSIQRISNQHLSQPLFTDPSLTPFYDPSHHLTPSTSSGHQSNFMTNVFPHSAPSTQYSSYSQVAQVAHQPIPQSPTTTGHQFPGQAQLPATTPSLFPIRSRNRRYQK